MLRNSVLLVCHTQTGGVAGMGHFARCCAVCEEAVDRGWEVVLVVEDENNPEVLSRVDQRARVLAAHTPRAARSEVQSALAAATRNESVLLVDLVDQHMTVSHPDRRLFDVVVAMHGSDEGIHTDLVVNQPFSTGPQARDYSVKAVRREVRSRRPSAPWQRSAVDNVLVSFGASDPGQQTEMFLLRLAEIELAPRVTIAVGAQIDSTRREVITGLCRVAGADLVAHDDLAAAIADSDLLVSLGGQTSYEAMHLGKPVAVVEWAHVATSSNALAADGLALSLGTLPSAVNRLADLVCGIDALQQTARRGWEVIDGRGAERVLDRIVELLPS